ncbi:ABC transporter substrate-binding protein [Paenibacillus dendritiformis]|uniref:ABC transporter substrate-binding protein n=1 Tax=Paenibacillus dendritiformis TaxID=130049 RepID=UPI0036505B54
MRQKGSVLLAMLLSISLLLAACSGGGGAKQGAEATDPADAAKAEELFSPVGEFPIAKEPMTLKMFAPQSASIENLETNEFTKFLEEKTNIQIKWDVVPEGALEEKKQLMMASGDYPEVILAGSFSKADQMKYGQQAVFIPLNDLIEKYAPNIKQAMADIPYLKDAMTTPDGNIYAIPKVNECYHCTYASKMWINQKWLDQLGLKMPTTTEEFYETLKAFKEKDPNGNGKQDEIPLTTAGKKEMWGGGLDAYLMNAFIYNDATTYMYLDNGELKFSPNQEPWREGLRYIHKLYAEGLIDKASFTQNADAVKQVGNRPDNVMGAVATALISYVYSPNELTPRHKDYVTVPPLKGPEGVQLAGYFVGAGNGQFAITNKATAEQQIAAIRFADYLYSEEATLFTSMGREGGGYRKAEAGEKTADGTPARFKQTPKPNVAQVQNGTWQELGIMKMTNELRDSFAVPEDMYSEDGYGLRLRNESKKYEPFAKPEIAFPSDIFIAAEDASLAAQLQTSINDYVESNMAQFITGSKDLDKDWDAYVKGFDGLQLSKYLEIYSKALKK